MVIPTLLPIDAVLPDLVESLRKSDCLVLQAATGAGKTTRVPQALLDAELSSHGGQILLLEPRRLAARAAARRIAWERGGQVGDEIGYQVRFEQRCGPRTRALAMTDGILLRRLQDDPFLETVSMIVFDEFHERSVNGDLALAMARRVQQTVRPDLKLIVMSATLTAEPIARFLGDCPIMTSVGRLHPVEIRYASRVTSTPMVDQAAQAVIELLPQTPGDVLVFLPGVREIHQVSRLLDSIAAQERLAIMPLYGDLSPEQQDLVLGRTDDGRRKVVLATNVAETSVTIDGVTAVVDSGQVRQLQFDAGLGLDRLVLTRISKASADQRAGRAGRTQPGVCVRLWLEREQRGMIDQTAPEIRRVDVSAPVLELLCWGESNVEAFPWFEPPTPDALVQATTLLERLGAIHAGQVTDIGRMMVRLPMHPRLSRMLLEGQRLGVPESVAWVAALLSERDPFDRQEGQRGSSRGPMHHSDSDLVDRIQALDEFHRHGSESTSMGRVNRSAARSLEQAQQQFLRSIEKVDRTGTKNGGVRNKHDAILRSILAGFPDRVAHRREHLGRKGVMVGGRGVRLLDSSPVLEPEYFVCVETDAGQGETFVRMASGIKREWLDPVAIESKAEVSFDPLTEKIVALRLTRYLDLIIEEVVIPPPPETDVAAILAHAARPLLDRVMPSDNPELAAFLARVQCLKEWMPHCDLPDFDATALGDLLPSLCRNCRSFADLKRAPWLETLRNSLTYAQLQVLEKEAPARLTVPSGSQIPVQYEPGRAPILAVRIQELFGLARTPRIAGGRIPVVLHLLGPNYRPQQITDDLTSFWNNTYPDVRKELKRRYPKHSWPEDPWSATPERKPTRK